MIILLLSSSGLAKEPVPIMKRVKEFKTIMEGRDLLGDTLRQATQMQEEYDSKTKYNVDTKTAQLLQALKNPFVPQLPAPLTEPPPDTGGQTPPPPILPPPPGDGRPGIPAPAGKISGLVWNTDRPQAIFNGRVVNVGDKLEQWTVTHISQSGVELRQGDRVHFIKP